MELFHAHAKIFLEYLFLPTKSWKNYPQKLLRTPQIHFFFLTAQTAQTEEFRFQNVAYWLTVYRTGVSTMFRKWLNQAIASIIMQDYDFLLIARYIRNNGKYLAFFNFASDWKKFRLWKTPVQLGLAQKLPARVHH